MRSFVVSALFIAIALIGEQWMVKAAGASDWQISHAPAIAHRSTTDWNRW